MQDFTPFYAGTPVETTPLPEGITFPVKYAVIRRKVMNNTFGMVRRNRDGSRRPHQGWDFALRPDIAAMPSPTEKSQRSAIAALMGSTSSSNSRMTRVRTDRQTRSTPPIAT